MIYKNKDINEIVGINIGKNKSTQSDIDDYLYCVEKLGMYSDYITINISSPNTPGLRELQLRGRIELLVKKIQPFLQKNRLFCKRGSNASHWHANWHGI